MKPIVFTISIFVAVLQAAAGANAATINFSEVAAMGSNPTIGDVNFWAGSPAGLNDAYIDDAWTPGNAYLASGYDDGFGKTPSLYDTFIGADLSSGELFTSISLDILSELILPGGTTLSMEAILGGSIVAVASVTVNDNMAHSLSVSYGAGFDTLYIYDDLDGFSFGEPFQIDNFNYSTTSSVVPEPSTFLLLSAGMLGLNLFRKKYL